MSTSDTERARARQRQRKRKLEIMKRGGSSTGDSSGPNKVRRTNSSQGSSHASPQNARKMQRAAAKPASNKTAKAPRRNKRPRPARRARTEPVLLSKRPQAKPVKPAVVPTPPPTIAAPSNNGTLARSSSDPTSQSGPDAKRKQAQRARIDEIQYMIDGLDVKQSQKARRAAAHKLALYVRDSQHCALLRNIKTGTTTRGVLRPLMHRLCALYAKEPDDATMNLASAAVFLHLSKDKSNVALFTDKVAAFLTRLVWDSSEDADKGEDDDSGPAKPERRRRKRGNKQELDWRVVFEMDTVRIPDSSQATASVVASLALVKASECMSFKQFLRNLPITKMLGDQLFDDVVSLQGCDSQVSYPYHLKERTRALCEVFENMSQPSSKATTLSHDHSAFIAVLNNLKRSVFPLIRVMLGCIETRSPNRIWSKSTMTTILSVLINFSNNDPIDLATEDVECILEGFVRMHAISSFDGYSKCLAVMVNCAEHTTAFRARFRKHEVKNTEGGSVNAVEYFVRIYLQCLKETEHKSEEEKNQIHESATLNRKFTEKKLTASFITLLLGCLLRDPAYKTLISNHLPNGNVGLLIETLKQYVTFQSNTENLTRHELNSIMQVVKILKRTQEEIAGIQVREATKKGD